ncbi:MAG: preprotein translocase subunit SecG [Granulosicoccus sp.]|nr:preprotein translocase subunit SecG [Granulosicoccus sp.]
MQSLALVIHVVLAIGVIGLVLIQHGKGADAGAAFGSGASATVFGAKGSASFLTRATTALAALFFLTSIFLFYLAANREGSVRSVTDVPGMIEEAPAVSTDLPGGVTDESGETAIVAPPAAGADSQGDSDLPAPAQ